MLSNLDQAEGHMARAMESLTTAQLILAKARAAKDAPARGSESLPVELADFPLTKLPRGEARTVTRARWLAAQAMELVVKSMSTLDACGSRSEETEIFGIETIDHLEGFLKAIKGGGR